VPAYFGSILGVLVLNLLAGVLACTVRRGALVGLYAGVVSGLVGLATMALQAVAIMPVLRADPQNIAEAARRAGHLDASTYLAGEQLVAGTSHLVLVGLVAGTVLAAVGATVRASVRRAGTWRRGRAVPRSSAPVPPPPAAIG